MNDKVDVARIQRAYLKMRAKKAELNKAHEKAVAEIDEAMETLETYMLGIFNSTGIDSAKTAVGTCYVETVKLPSCKDWEKFYTWMSANDAFGALEKRVSRSFVTTYMQEHQDELPPGISIHTERKVRFRTGND